MTKSYIVCLNNGHKYGRYPICTYGNKESAIEYINRNIKVMRSLGRKETYEIVSTKEFNWVALKGSNLRYQNVNGFETSFPIDAKIEYTENI